MAYYESDRYANRRANRNYGNERNSRYDDDRYSSSRSYGNNRNDNRNRSEDYSPGRYSSERGSMWEDNDHGRASWYEQDHGWRSSNRDNDYDYYGGDNGRYEPQRSRNYTGGYDNDEGNYGRYSSPGYSRDDEYSARNGRSDNYGRENDYRGNRRRSGSDYGTGFNEERGRMSDRRSDYDPRTRSGSQGTSRNKRWDDDYTERDYDTRRY